MIRIIDDFAPIGLVNAARATWPAATWEHWHRYTGDHGDKFTTKDAARLTPACRALIERMSELPVEPGTFPDLDLHGAGMQWIPTGGRLPLHRDAQRHPLKSWRRRVNAILYLDQCEGGVLTFRDADGKETGRVAPRVNRLAIFSADGLHEVTTVSRGNRRTLSLFWWEESEGSGNTSAEWMVTHQGEFRSRSGGMNTQPEFHEPDEPAS